MPMMETPPTPPISPPPPPPHLPLPPIPTDAQQQQQQQQPSLPPRKASLRPTAPGRRVSSNHTTNTSNSTAPNGSDALLRALRDRSREQYHRLKSQPSISEISARSNSTSVRSAKSAPAPAKYNKHSAAAAAVAGISTISSKGRSLHSLPASPVMAPLSRTSNGGGRCVPTGGLENFGRWEDASCLGYAGAPRHAVAAAPRYIGGLKHRVKTLWKGFHVSVSVSFSGDPDEPPRLERLPRRTEMTIRIKNNKTGSPAFEVIRDSSAPEALLPIDSLKTLFPDSKPLAKALTDWNRHFQNPPPHWVVNFIPRAYLRRGFFLAEEVCDYLVAHPDGCRYRVEYEPIGHEWCLVGTIVPRPKRVRRNFSMQWEGKEKY